MKKKGIKDKNPTLLSFKPVGLALASKGHGQHGRIFLFFFSAYLGAPSASHGYFTSTGPVYGPHLRLPLLFFKGFLEGVKFRVDGMRLVPKGTRRLESLPGMVAPLFGSGKWSDLREYSYSWGG